MLPVKVLLEGLEQDRGNSRGPATTGSPRSGSLFAWAALRHPEHAATIGRVLAMTPKQYQRNLFTYLTGGPG